MSLIPAVTTPAAADAPKSAPAQEAAQDSLHTLSAKSIDGKSVSFADYKGKVVLIVNTASECGYTGQYAGLEALYAKYRDKGLVVLGFPSHDFRQEPGSGEEIAKFCKVRYGVTFPLFEKGPVSGAAASPRKWIGRRMRIFSSSSTRCRPTLSPRNIGPPLSCGQP